MRYFIFGYILLLSNWHCLRPQLRELPFFTVNIETITYPKLGELDMTAALDSLGSLSVDETGFILSRDLAKIQGTQPSGGERVTATLPAGGKRFSARYARLQAGDVWYVRAFARIEDRMVYSTLQAFSLGQLIDVSIPLNAVTNDVATVQGTIIGLQEKRLSVDHHGHVFSKTRILPQIGLPGCDTTDFKAKNIDYTFNSQLRNLDLNSRYYVRAYLTAGRDTFYSKVRIVSVGDGWKRSADFPRFYKDGFGAAFSAGKEAYVACGCPLPRQLCTDRDLIANMWIFRPEAALGQQWTAAARFPASDLRIRSAALYFKDTLYVLGGSYREADAPSTLQFGGGFWQYVPKTNQWRRASITPIAALQRSGAVFFALKNKLYVGTGEVAAGTMTRESGDFWEYNPATARWRKVASLPLVYEPGGKVTTRGRHGAFAFPIGDRAYVGGGKTEITYIRDYWRFTPPVSEQDSGRWELMGFFPGAGREDATSFTIGDTKGYYGIGFNGSVGDLDDWWEFNPTAPQPWVARTHFVGGRRRQAIGFGLHAYGYLGAGINKIITNNGNNVDDEGHVDFWRYEPLQ